MHVGFVPRFPLIKPESCAPLLNRIGLSVCLRFRFKPAEQVHTGFHAADSAISPGPESSLFVIRSATSIEIGELSFRRMDFFPWSDGWESLSPEKARVDRPCPRA